MSAILHLWAQCVHDTKRKHSQSPQHAQLKRGDTVSRGAVRAAPLSSPGLTAEFWVRRLLPGTTGIPGWARYDCIQCPAGTARNNS